MGSDHERVTSTTLPRSAPPQAMRPDPRLRVPPGLLQAVFVLGGLGVIWLWWHGTPATLHSAADWFTEAGRISGLVCGWTVVSLLVVMARVPAVERGVGADRLARWHASLGRYTICLVVAHAFLLLVGYSLADHRGPVSEAGRLLTGFSGVLLAVIGTALLVVVGIVSARAARARLSYEVWYYLHLTTYVAVALSFLHQVRNGAQFISAPTARHVWWALYLGAGALLLVFRVVLPVWTSTRQQMRVVDVHHEAPGVVSIVVAGNAIGELGAEPGQFFRWRFLTRHGWWASHPFSLSAPPHGNLLRITVKALGDHSKLLQRVRRGTRVLVAGPYGALTAARRTRPKVLLVAGGVGITPLRALFETIPARPGDLTLVYRASRPKDLVFRSELDAIAARRGAVVHYCVGRRGGPADPLVGTRLSRLVPKLAEHDVYVCGPPGLTENVVDVVRTAGVPRRNVHVESFDLVEA